MSTGGSSTGSSRNAGQRRPALGELVDVGDGKLGVGKPKEERQAEGQRTPKPRLPADDQPTVISAKPSSSGPMPTLSGQEWTEALIGQTLGHYELQEIVGAGGMGAVFRGHDTALDKTVAVKVLLPTSGDDEDLLRRFKNEAQSAARLDHIHAARVYYVGEERGLHYIVYEYIEGRNIRDLTIESGPLSTVDALRYTFQIADTLAHAAARDVVHRDIKPSNILVTDEGIAKLVDMGLARLHQVEHSGGDLTASGVTLGTFDFISPEQARDPRRADVRSDIYSLGCTLYFMLTGQPPFPSGTVLQKLLQHEGDAPPDARQLRADCPDELANIIRTMLAKKPEHRYQTPALLMGDLAGFAQRAGLGPLGASGATAVTTRRRRELSAGKHVPWIAAVAVLAVLVVLVDATSRSDDASSLFSPYPNSPPTQKAPSTEDDPPQASRQGATPPDRSDTAKGGNASPSTDRPTDILPNRSDDGNRVASADGPDIRPAAAPSVVVDALHPLRAELDNAIRGATRSATPGVSASTSDAGAPSVALSARAVRERAGPDSVASEAAGAFVDVPGVANVVVGASSDGSPTFASLDAALDAALERLEKRSLRDDRSTADDAIRDVAIRDEDWLIRVELRFDGPLACDPIRIERANVDIFASDGFSPVLVFRPVPAEDAELPGAITVVEGELTIERVAVELTTPPELAAQARMFEAQEADLIRVRDCSLTISSSVSEDAASRKFVSNAAFFDVAASRAAAAIRVAPDMPEMNGAMPLLTIRVERCVARGDADMVRVGGARNARLTWSNGLAVLGGSLLSIEGSRQSLPGAHVRAMLTHVTAGLRGNLVSIANAQTTPFLPVVEVESYDGIFVGTDHPLIVSQGVDSIEDFRDRFRWKGERNFYDNWTRLWRIHGVGFESEPEEMGFRDWVSHWGRAESAPSLGPVIWRNPISLARPPHEQQLSDFALADTDANPARASGEKGTNAGASFDQLPPLPWPGQFVDGSTR